MEKKTKVRVETLVPRQLDLIMVIIILMHTPSYSSIKKDILILLLDSDVIIQI